MDLNKVSEKSLKNMHNAIKKILEEEDSLPRDENKLHFVREFPDWQRIARQLEKAMQYNKYAFRPIKWD